MKTVLITGATSGFGEACAHIFAQNQHDLIITGRRSDRLQSLKNTVEEKYGVSCHASCFDIRDRNQVYQAIEALPAAFRGVEILVNNAGLALGRDLFDEASVDDWEIMISTNISGLLYITRAVLPLMREAGSGHIINIGSTAAKEVYERGNVYCASKSAVDALSRAMRIDLLSYGIRVTAIHPGAAETEFSLVRFRGNADEARKVYEGYQPLTAEDVARIIHYAASLPPHVCINDLVVTCTQQANAFYFNRNT